MFKRNTHIGKPSKVTVLFVVLVTAILSLVVIFSFSTPGFPGEEGVSKMSTTSASFDNIKESKASQTENFSEKNESQRQSKTEEVASSKTETKLLLEYSSIERGVDRGHRCFQVMLSGEFLYTTTLDDFGDEKEKITGELPSHEVENYIQKIVGAPLYQDFRFDTGTLSVRWLDANAEMHQQEWATGPGASLIETAESLARQYGSVVETSQECERIHLWHEND